MRLCFFTFGEATGQENIQVVIEVRAGAMVI